MQLRNSTQQKARTRRAFPGFRGSQWSPAKVYLVRTERLELSHLAALEPKSSVSTNSTTSAFQTVKAKAPDYESGALFNMGWTMGFEPTTAGVTILCSTN